MPRVSGFVHLLFVVLDVKSGSYYPPFAARTIDEALRSFEDLLSNPQSVLSKHPKDYRLYMTGEFHEDTGAVVSVPEGIVLVEQSLQLVKEA